MTIQLDEPLDESLEHLSQVLLTETLRPIMGPPIT